MELGLGLLSAQRLPGDDRSASERYGEVLELGRAAEDAGLDSVWTSEHHFTDDEYLSGTMPTLGALAGATEEIELASGVALTPFYDPVRLAEDAATVQAISDDRLTLGLSIGYLDFEFENFGVPKDERTDRTEDAIELLRNAWEPGSLGYDSDFHPISPDAEVTPTPDEPPEIVLGALAKPAVRRAARMGDGWCANEMLSVDDIELRQDDIEQVREEEDIGGEFTTYVVQYGFVGDTYEEAWETLRDGYFYQQRKYQEWAEGEEVDELSDEQREELEERAIVGTPEDVAEELGEYRDALGEDVHFVFRPYAPGIENEELLECIRRLGEEVAPRL
ncbi:LLM class flavin-dependent oxidoreductase [Halalkalicoccus ordinarius]|uniref:LLM class flavin-dependent oxidoreductase n=1 Tax=Halalkalicoccus ordinarius TaxID=3116651 RepID=UPI00300F0629